MLLDVEYGRYVFPNLDSSRLCHARTISVEDGICCMLKKWIVFFSCLILGPVSGLLLGGLWVDGANTFWERIDYLPFPVDQLVYMNRHGSEFWIETDNHSIRHVLYPCEDGQTCWDEDISIPTDEGNIPGQYVVSAGSCKNNSFVYPLLWNIKTCATSTILHPDAYNRVSLALTTSGDLWIWEKDAIDPFTMLFYMMFSLATGAIMGFLISLYLVWKMR